MRLVAHLTIVTLLVVVTWVEQAAAVVFYDTVPATHNTTAPGGIYADSGWRYQGEFGNYLGTMISPRHLITAAHLGTGPTEFVHKAVFNGTASDVVYTIDTSADGDGSNWWWTLPGTDLRIFQVDGTFPYYAQLYAGSDEIGKELVVMGRGTRRGADVVVGLDLKGWKEGTADHVARWGRNVVSGTEDRSVGPVLVAEFNAVSGVDEAHLTVGDSGGAVFLQEDGIWKLAGINWAVDGNFDDDSDHADNGFRATLFDMGGLWIGNNDDGWSFTVDQASDIPSHFYASRVSAHRSAIGAIILIPEPSSLILLLGFGGTWVAWLLWRRRHDD